MRAGGRAQRKLLRSIILGTRLRRAASKLSNAVLKIAMLFHFAWACALFVALLCASGSAAQIDAVAAPSISPVPVNVKRFAVSGSVLNSLTNEPIRRALVRVNANKEQRIAFTGPDGRFQLADIPEGAASASAQRPGYFDSPNRMEYSSGHTLLVGSGTNEIRIFLTPDAKVLGTAIDRNGEPIAGLMVQVLAAQVVEGRKQWVSQGATSTDDRGAYPLDGLRPGDMAVCTGAKLLQATADRGVSYAPRCFPNSPDPANAQLVNVTPGATIRADVAVEAVPSFSVSGTVTGVLPNLSIWIEGPEGQQSYAGNPRIDPVNGQFSLPFVPDGTWRVHYQSNDGQGRSGENIEEVTVNGSAPVTGLQINLQFGIDIPIELIQPVASPT